MEPLGEAFGQNLETVNVNKTQSAAREVASISLNTTNTGDGLKREQSTSNAPSSAIMRYMETLDDSSAEVAVKPEESQVRTKLLDIVNKEGEDVFENMETIIARNVEQGKCASFKKVESLNDKRSINEPRYTQVSGGLMIVFDFSKSTRILTYPPH